MVDNKNQLENLQNHTNGEIVYCKDEQKMYQWNGANWNLVVPGENSELKMKLYDLNKNVINQLIPLTDDEIKSKMDVIQSYRLATNNIHYMLLCKEFNYYTIFTFSPGGLFEPFAKTVKDIITDLGGPVYSIGLTKDKMAIEIWIKPAGEEEPLVFYLFAYDAGVVEYG